MIIRNSLRATLSLLALATSLLSLRCHQDDTRVFPTGDPANFVVLVDQSFSDEQRDIIREAGNEWVDSLGGCLSLSYIVTPTTSLRETTSENGIINMFLRKPAEGKAGWTSWSVNGTGAFIYIDPAYDADVFFRIVQHELGHAFHLVHYTGPAESIMRPNVEINSSNLTLVDVTAFCEEWRCCDLFETKSPQ